MKKFPDYRIVYNYPYLIYKFFQPEVGIRLIQQTKDLFLEMKDARKDERPVVVIDVSFEGRTNPEYYTFLDGWDIHGVCIWSELHYLLSQYHAGWTVLVSNDGNIARNYEKWLKNFKLNRVFGECIYRPRTLLDRSVHYYENNPTQQHLPFKPKHFICMNGATSKIHRFDMVHLLFANGWDKKGYISYLNRYGPTTTYSLPNDRTHFEGQTLKLDFDGDSIDNGGNQETLPPQYSEACFDIVTESIICDTSLHITEKVWKPILHEKPFIILGPKFAHKHLLDHFGIKPYTDLFNYEFDTLGYPEKLHSIKEKNLDRLLNMNINELNDIVNSDSMKEQMAYNKAQLLAYSKSEQDGDKIPIEKNIYKT